MTQSDKTIPSRTVGEPVREVRVVVEGGRSAGSEATARDETITVGSAEDNEVVLQDRTVSRYHAEIRRDGDRIRVVDLGSTNGVRIGDVLVRDGSVTVSPGSKIALGNSLLDVSDGETVVVQKAVWSELGHIKGRSQPMQRLMDSVAQLSQKDTPVLLLGESGTGKELVARALHDLGPRAESPFVTIDCASLTSTLFASELFGHERGAFTGAAQQHQGAFERANGGTVFLDEIGEMPPEQQAALLGVLERRVLRRVGGSAEIPVDVRVVCATNRDLRAEVNAGTFRLDLYYRIAVVLLTVPALRERAGDIPILVEHFLREEGYSGAMSDLFDESTLQRLAAHRWPGNVRELRNVVAAALATGEAQLVDGPEGHGTTDVIAGVLEKPYKPARRVVTNEFEVRYLTRLLERSEGSVRGAARLAGIDRTYLSSLLKRHGIR